MLAAARCAAATDPGVAVALDKPAQPGQFVVADAQQAAPLVYSSADAPLVAHAVKAFAGDVRAVAGVEPRVLTALPGTGSADGAEGVIVAGTLGHNEWIDGLVRAHRLDVESIRGQWEAAEMVQIRDPWPGVRQALVVVASDRRGLAFALFDLSRRMGVSPWSWWADVPVARHTRIAVSEARYIQPSPAVPYRGIFLNDEDWGLRPWAAKKMDPEVGNIGPHTYERIFELLLRLHANTLWPAMHPGTTAFHAIRANSLLADEWGIVMGSSHSEALTRNNVGEWNESTDGPWNYQTNKAAIDRYWDEILASNSGFENLYTVGMRGVHDGPLEATGTVEEKARLVEQVMADQQQTLQRHIDAPLSRIPQVLWLYKESLDLYNVGMKVPAEVTLGWTDDNYGYFRRLPNAAEQARAAGSGLYYHVSYWGRPHDYLWLCTTPPALMREELGKAWDRNVRRIWVLNVGDIKPAESDIDYFLQFALDPERMRRVEQRQFLSAWLGEQFGAAQAGTLTGLLERYYQLSFVRKPEFMGFNGYDDDVNHTAFNPQAWGDQNRQRRQAWEELASEAEAAGKAITHANPAASDAYYELVGYPIEAAAAQDAKFLWADRAALDQAHGASAKAADDQAQSRAAWQRIQTLTADYNALAGGKWQGMMSAAPRERHVFDAPKFEKAGPTQTAAALPSSWAAGVAQPLFTLPGCGAGEQNQTVSVRAADYAMKAEATGQQWERLQDLGLSGASMAIAHMGTAQPAAWVNATGTEAQDESMRDGLIAKAARLDYCFATRAAGEATLTVYLLPTFPLDNRQQLRFAVRIDGGEPRILNVAAVGATDSVSSVWSVNVLRNAATAVVRLGTLGAGRHQLSLIYGEPGVVFEHWTITEPGAPPAYPFAPVTEARPATPTRQK